MAKGLGQLDRAMEALMGATGNDRLERVSSLVWLRQLTDPTMPGIAGFDPRTLGPSLDWKEAPAPEGMVRQALDALFDLLNAQMPEPLLSVGWEQHTDERSALAAVTAVAKWRPPSEDQSGGDLQGEILQVYRPEKASNGAYYTPYPVCRLMALINEPQPGETVMDPACGSGRMLLAALEVCRQSHGGDPVLYGTDIDHQAIRACRLNLVLAGVNAAVAPADSLTGRRLLDAAARTTDTDIPEAA